jgi:hypothetical protein
MLWRGGKLAPAGNRHPAVPPVATPTPISNLTGINYEKKDLSKGRLERVRIKRRRKEE